MNSFADLYVSGSLTVTSFIVAHTTFNNSGVVNLLGGQATLGDGGTDTGTFNVAAGATLDFSEGTHALNSGATITGAGTVEVSAAPLKVTTVTFAAHSRCAAAATVIAGGTADFSSGSSLTTTTLTESVRGVLNVSGDVSVPGPLTWTGGTMSGTGTTYANGGLTVSGFDAHYLIGRALNVSAGAEVTGGYFYVQNGSVITNAADSTFDIQSSIGNGGGAASALVNYGTLQKSGAGTSVIGVALNNSGTVDVQTGTLVLAAGGDNTGTFSVAAGGTLNFSNSYNLEGGSAEAGAGTALLSGGTLTAAGNATFQNLTQSGGILTGAGTLTVNGAMNWTGGTMTGTGTTAIAATGSLALSDTIAKVLTQRMLATAGPVTWSAGPIYSGGGATISNSGTWDLRGNDALSFNQGGAAPAFSNSGTVRKSAGSATSAIGVPFNNNGTLEVHSGTVSLTSTVAQVSGNTLTGGTWYVGPNSTLSLSGTLTTNQGNVTLDGPGSQFAALNNLASNAGSFALPDGRSFTTAGNFSNSGGLTVGAGSTLAVRGAFTQTAAGSLTVQLAGTGAGQFGQVAVTGAAALGGALNVTEVGGYTPAAGDSFPVLPSASTSGDFATRTGFQPGGGLFLREDFQPAGLTLEAFQAHLVFVQQPTDTVAGQPISPAVMVAIVDQYGNVETGDNSDTVTVTLGSNPGGGTLQGTLMQMVVNGVATFPDLTLVVAASGYTLAATSGSLAALTSNAFAVNPAAADHLLFVQQPTDTIAGQPISPAVMVEIVDQSGNVLTNDNSDTVTLSLGSNPGGDTLGGTLTQTVSGGVATFGDLTLTRAAGGYTLVANGAGLAAVTSAGFAVNPAAADHLLFLQQPTVTAAGQTMSAVVVEIVDQYGNVETGDNSDAVTLTLSGGVMLNGTPTQTVVNGVATFDDLSITQAGSYTLHASVGGALPDIDSTSFAVNPAAADHLLFLQQPTDTAAGQTLSPVVVEIVDAYGNVVTGDSTDTVTLSLGVDPSGGTATFSGTLTVTVTNGVATFGDLYLDTSGAGYTLHATVGGSVPDIDSNSFNVL